MTLFEGFRRPVNHHIASGNQAGGVGGNYVTGGSANVPTGTDDHRVGTDGGALLSDRAAAIDACLLAAGQQTATGLGFAVVAVIAVLRRVQV